MSVTRCTYVQRALNSTKVYMYSVLWSVLRSVGNCTIYYTKTELRNKNWRAIRKLLSSYFRRSWFEKQKTIGERLTIHIKHNKNKNGTSLFYTRKLYTLWKLAVKVHMNSQKTRLRSLNKPNYQYYITLDMLTFAHLTLGIGLCTVRLPLNLRTIWRYTNYFTYLFT